MGPKMGKEVSEAKEPNAAFSGSGMVPVAAGSRAPVLDRRLLEKGTQVTFKGSHSPKVQDIKSETVAMAKVVVDSRDAILAEAGDILIPISGGVISNDRVYAELGDPVTDARASRTTDDCITLCKSVGLALQESAGAARAYRVAEETGIGNTAEFGVGGLARTERNRCGRGLKQRVEALTADLHQPSMRERCRDNESAVIASLD
jgi:ornithine cyclodeaminase/alanine dehydrogenase-like protein (mu-crystallin family)